MPIFPLCPTFQELQADQCVHCSCISSNRYRTKLYSLCSVAGNTLRRRNTFMDIRDKDTRGRRHDRNTAKQHTAVSQYCGSTQSLIFQAIPALACGTVEQSCFRTMTRRCVSLLTCECSILRQQAQCRNPARLSGPGRLRASQKPIREYPALLGCSGRLTRSRTDLDRRRSPSTQRRSERGKAACVRGRRQR